MAELKPCPFCGGKARLNYHQSKYYGQNDYGAKYIGFTGYMVCNKCRSRGRPVTAICDRVHMCGWKAELEERMLPLAIEAWNRRAEDGKT